MCVSAICKCQQCARSISPSSVLPPAATPLWNVALRACYLGHLSAQSMTDFLPSPDLFKSGIARINGLLSFILCIIVPSILLCQFRVSRRACPGFFIGARPNGRKSRPKAKSGGGVLGCPGSAVSSPAGFGAEPRPPKSFPHFQHCRMASLDSNIVNCGLMQPLGKTAVPPPSCGAVYCNRFCLCVGLLPR